MVKRAFYLGIDVGGTFTKVALVDRSGRIIAKVKISSQGFSCKDSFLGSLRKCFKDLQIEAGVPASSCRGIGVGLPGPVDPERGLVLSLTNIPGWKDFPLVDFLKRSLSVPVSIENDANAMALAEARKGAARGFSHVLCLTLGTGVGGGLIMDGRIYRGPMFMGGEVGHIPVVPDGPSCECGGRGCLELYVGNRAILARARRLFGRPVALEDLSVMARKGHGRARKIWQDVGARIGFAMAGVVNVFNPQVIVIGGGVSSAGSILIGAIRVALRRHAMQQLKGKVRIKRAQLGRDAGVLGAALLAMEKIEVAR
jgi:glucokinase